MKKGGLLYIFAYPIGAERRHSLISTAGIPWSACFLFDMVGYNLTNLLSQFLCQQLS